MVITCHGQDYSARLLSSSHGLRLVSSAKLVNGETDLEELIALLGTAALGLSDSPSALPIICVSTTDLATQGTGLELLFRREA